MSSAPHHCPLLGRWGCCRFTLPASLSDHVGISLAERKGAPVELLGRPGVKPLSYVGGDVLVPVGRAAHEQVGIGLHHVRRLHLEIVLVLLHVRKAALLYHLLKLLVGERLHTEEPGYLTHDARQVTLQVLEV